MISVNPFSDPSVKKQILTDSGITPVEEVEDFGGFENIISGTPVIPDKAGSTIKTIIRDAGAVVKDQNQERSVLLNNAINDVFSQYNKEYGLNLHIDLNSLSKTLVACADERNTKLLELFASKVIRSIRPILILNMISKLALALDVLLAPDNLLDRSQLSLTDLFLATDQILNYIQKLEALKEEIMIPNEDLELKKLAESGGLDLREGDEEMIQNFMRLFKKENGL